MIPAAGPSIPRWAWALAVCFLTSWNAFLAQYASPFSQTQAYDGAQYQLLARNRLTGSYHVGDQAHTVRDEASHPMWRPGLVWLTEGVARITGSVSQAAWILSATATTLMELTLLWLGWRCFGRTAWVILLAAMCLPFHWSAIFLSLAIGQGPEPWAALFTLLGWAVFLKASDCKSLFVAAWAGVIIGGADWFRTGNLLMFAAPWAVFGGLAAVCRARRELAQSLTMLAGFTAITFLSNLLASSTLNKTVANFWGNLVEHHGLQLVKQTEYGANIQYLGGLVLAPGAQQTYYDYIVRASGTSAGEEFWREKRTEIISLYLQRLGDVVSGGGHGLRVLAGESTIVLALVGVVFALLWRDARAVVTLAFLAGFLGHYLGPVVLLRGDTATHYLFVALPLLALVGSGGAAAIVDSISSAVSPTSRRSIAVVALCVVSIPAIAMAKSFYLGGIYVLAEEHGNARQEYESLDLLQLEGKRIATRSMAWFADRKVQTVLCPYVRVVELEQYAVYHGLDGVLLRCKEKHGFFNAMPYGSFSDFEAAMNKSGVFGPTRTSGVWKWFPVSVNSHRK